MNLLMGVASVCIAALFFGVLLIACRNPNSPRWAAGFAVETIYVPMVVGLLVMGVCFLAQAAFADLTAAPGWLEILISLAVALFTVVALYLMRIRDRLAHYRALEAESERKSSVIAISPEAVKPDSKKPTPSRPRRMAA